MTATLSELKVGSLILYPSFDPFKAEYTVEHEGAGSAVVTATPVTPEAVVNYRFLVYSGYFGIDWNVNNKTVTWDNADFYHAAKLEITVTHDGTSMAYSIWLDNVTSV